MGLGIGRGMGVRRRSVRGSCRRMRGGWNGGGGGGGGGGGVGGWWGAGGGGGGHTVTRGAVRLFEVEDGADGIRAIGVGDVVGAEVEPRRTVTMRGEIVDPKCFAGAMKPGEG